MEKDTPHIAEQSANMTPDFFVIPSEVLYDPELQSLDAIVYGVVYWFERMKDGYCRASNATIAKVARSSSSGVSHSLQRLRDNGYIHCEYDLNNNRTSIVTLVHFSKGGISTEQGGVSQLSNILNKNTIKENKYSDEDLAVIERLYTYYIYRIKLHTYNLNALPDEEKLKVLDEAKKKYKLTDKRKEKLHARIKDAGPETVAKAILNVSKSEYHMGANDSATQYNDLADFICRSYEQIENWANKE